MHLIFKALFVIFILVIPKIDWAANRRDLTVHMKISRITGADTVDVLLPNGQVIQKGVGDKLYVGEVIQCRHKTAIQIHLSDGARITVGRNSSYKIEDVTYDEFNILRWSFRLYRGLVHGAVPNNGRKSPVKLKIRTPSGVMGVRGTEFVTTYSPKLRAMDLYTLKGEVLLSRDGRFIPGTYRTVHGGEYSKLPYYSEEASYPESWGTELGTLMQQFGISELIPEQNEPNFTNRDNTQPGQTIKKENFTAEDCERRGKGWKQNPKSRQGFGTCY